jgi:hypothetical protein
MRERGFAKSNVRGRFDVSCVNKNNIPEANPLVFISFVN